MQKAIVQHFISEFLVSKAMTALRVFTTITGLVVVTGCAAFVPSTGFPIRDSGLYASYNVAIYWLNDEEVLFGGPTGETRRRPDGVDEPVNRVSVWNIRTNEVQRYGEVAAQLCYYDGYIVYWERDVQGKRLWVNFGKLGQETREERGTLKPGEYFDTHTCRHHSELPSLPEWTKGFSVRRLIPQHGFLINEYGFRNTPYNFCPARAERHQCVPLPIKRNETKGFTWYVFKQAYFAVGDYFHPVPNHTAGGYNISPWPKGLPMPVWWLHPDGRTEEIKLPAGPWLEAFVFPTRNGMVTLGKGPSPFLQTLYLIKDVKGISLLNGIFHRQAVSPDGCRFAVTYDPKEERARERGFPPIKLIAFEFCKGVDRDVQHR